MRRVKRYLLDDLEWDVKGYFAWAKYARRKVSVWGIKGWYDTVQ